MNFGSRDVKILMSMLIAVFMITYTLPAIGLADVDRQSPDQAPEVDIGADTFDFAGDQPRRPETAEEVILYTGPDAYDSDDIGFFIGSEGATERLYMSIDAISVDGGIGVTLTYINVGTGITDTEAYTFNESNTKHTYRLSSDNATEDIVINAEMTEYDNSTTPVSSTITGEAQTLPGGSGFLNSIPVFGDALNGIYQTIAWIGLMFMWVSLVIVGFFVSVATTTVDIGIFIFGMLSFLVGGYGSVVSAAPGIASLILAIPGLLLTFELAKIGMLLLDLIWFG